MEKDGNWLPHDTVESTVTDCDAVVVFRDVIESVFVLNSVRLEVGVDDTEPVTVTDLDRAGCECERDAV